MGDILSDFGPVFLGSRLKRLAERMQAGAAQVISEAGLPVQPSHMSLLAALDAAPLTTGELVEAIGSSQPGVTRGVGQLVAMGLVESAVCTDQRQRRLSLTNAGQAAVARAKLLVWPRVEAAVIELCAGLSGSFIDQVGELENALAARPLHARAADMQPKVLTLRDYSDDLAAVFHDINVEWITAMFRLEPTDRDVLENPRVRIIEGGGAILFVKAAGLGIIGTCALQKTGDTSFELTKMGVRAVARGLKAGEFLLEAVIKRAGQLGADPLYLLTNKACAAAIHLYEKAGFEHDPNIMAKYGVRYERCDVAMRYRPPAHLLRR